MDQPIEMRLVRDGERIALASPGVGTFTCALRRGAVLVPGQEAGVLTTLGRSRALLVPQGGGGVVVSERPELVRDPVGYGAVLYELAPVGEQALAGPAGEESRAAKGGNPLAVRASSSGRFYHRPSPGEPPFVAPGSVVEDGRPIGLIEVMKTFNHVHYRAAGGLPARARVVRFLVDDGADVRAGDGLLEVAGA